MIAGKPTARGGILIYVAAALVLVALIYLGISRGHETAPPAPPMHDQQ